MRVAALDVGQTRIGMAIFSPEMASVFPIGTFQRRSLNDDLERLALEFKSRQIDKIIVGLPCNMDGSEGEPARRMRRFALRIAESLGIPVEMYDERLTTFEARERLKGNKGSRARRRGAIDSIAAVVILESWLNSCQGSVAP
jgi:putative Holliday junction resolvase